MTKVCSVRFCKLLYAMPVKPQHQFQPAINKSPFSINRSFMISLETRQIQKSDFRKSA